MLRCPDDYSVYYIDMPATVSALVSFDENGYPSVFVNARLSAFTQRRALKHELRHIWHNDVYNTDSIKLCEDRAEKREA